MTPGCTAESCHFRDLGAEFSALGAARVGISHDDVATQRRFSDRHGFDFPLLADVDGEVASSYGVRRPIGVLATRRWTFVIDRGRSYRRGDQERDAHGRTRRSRPRGAPGNARELTARARGQPRHRRRREVPLASLRASAGGCSSTRAR